MFCESPEWDSHEGNRLGTLRGLVACKTLSPIGESFGAKIHQSHRRHVTSSIDLTSFAPNFTDSLLLGPYGDLVPLHAIDKVAQNGKTCSMLPTQRVSWTSANTKELRGVAKTGDLKCDSQVSLFTDLLHRLGQPFVSKIATMKMVFYIYASRKSIVWPLFYPRMAPPRNTIKGIAVTATVSKTVTSSSKSAPLYSPGQKNPAP